MRDVSVGGGAVLVVLLAALVPVWTSTPPARDVADANLVPSELFGMLVQECQGVVPLDVDQTVLPNWVDSVDDDIGHRVWLALYQVDSQNGSISEIEPNAEQAAMLAAANSCLASYELDEWREPPQFDAFHRNMHYDYVAGALASCLTARGIDARIPSREAFKTLDTNIWYQARMVGLDFQTALSTWRSCPPFPAYLEEAGYQPDPAEVLRP